MGLIPGWGRSPGEGNGNPLVFLPGKEKPGSHIPWNWSPVEARVSLIQNQTIESIEFPGPGGSFPSTGVL